jgi:hypothetical protein
MASNAIASLTSMFMSLLAGDCLATNSLLQLTNSHAGGHLNQPLLFSLPSQDHLVIWVWVLCYDRRSVGQSVLV